jgi:hypothetical protein
VAHLPKDLAERVFSVLYPDHELIGAGEFYAVVHDGTLLVSDSIGYLAQSISELSSRAEVSVWSGVAIALPRRT